MKNFENNENNKEQLCNKLLKISEKILCITQLLKKLIYQIQPTNYLIVKKKEHYISKLEEISNYAIYLNEIINKKLTIEMGPKKESEKHNSAEELLFHFNKADKILRETILLAKNLELSQLYINNEGKLTKE